MFEFIQKILLCLLLIITTSHAAPFQNGSFEDDSALWQDNDRGFADILSQAEQDLTGWTIEHVAGVHNFVHWARNWLGGLPQYGAHYMVIAYWQGHMRLWQTFDTVIGQEYQVNFYMHKGYYPAGHYGGYCGSADHKTILLTIKENNGSGTTLATFDGFEPYASWNLHSFNFTATTSQTYLSLSPKAYPCHWHFFPGIDNITVTKVPPIIAPPDPPVFSLHHSIYPDDPMQLNLKSIPGQEMIMDASTSNNGGAVYDAGTQSWVFRFPTQMTFKANSIVCRDGEQTRFYNVSTLSGLFSPTWAANYYTINSSGFTNAEICASVMYSSDPAPTKFSTWVSSPGMIIDGYAPNVTGLRFKPSGIFADGSSGTTGYRVYFTLKIK
jgi:hypothetical protein